MVQPFVGAGVIASVASVSVPRVAVDVACAGGVGVVPATGATLPQPTRLNERSAPTDSVTADERARPRSLCH